MKIKYCVMLIMCFLMFGCNRLDRKDWYFTINGAEAVVDNDLEYMQRVTINTGQTKISTKEITDLYRDWKVVRNWKGREQNGFSFIVIVFEDDTSFVEVVLSDNKGIHSVHVSKFDKHLYEERLKSEQNQFRIRPW